MMNLILIGEAPGKRGDPKKVLNYPIFSSLGTCDRRNLFAERSAMDDGTGVRWPARLAMETASRIIPEIAYKYDRIIFVGKRVAIAFGFWEDYFRWQWFFTAGLPPCAVFPHPSGLNRWWNSKENRRRAEEFLKELE